MFSIYHYAWIAISLAFMAFCLWNFRTKKVPLVKVMKILFIFGMATEFIKIFALIKLVPSSDGTMMYPYLETQHIPFSLCGMQKYFAAFVIFSKNERYKENVMAFMYPTAAIGALVALFVPSGASFDWNFSGAFLNLQAYQFFLYHALLVAVGIYIPLSKEFAIEKRHLFSTYGMLLGLGLLSLFLNSAFANARYVADKVVSVDYVPNYLFTYKPPIKIPLTELWHWHAYLAVIAALAVIAVGLCYAPFLVKQTSTSNEKIVNQ